MGINIPSDLQKVDISNPNNGTFELDFSKLEEGKTGFYIPPDSKLQEITIVITGGVNKGDTLSISEIDSTKPKIEFEVTDIKEPPRKTTINLEKMLPIKDKTEGLTLKPNCKWFQDMSKNVGNGLIVQQFKDQEKEEEDDKPKDVNVYNQNGNNRIKKLQAGIKELDQAGIKELDQAGIKELDNNVKKKFNDANKEVNNAGKGAGEVAGEINEA